MRQLACILVHVQVTRRRGERRIGPAADDEPVLPFGHFANEWSAAAISAAPIIRSKATLTPRCSALARTMLSCMTFGAPVTAISAANRSETTMNAICMTLQWFVGK
jgi:hypothetical protein